MVAVVTGGHLVDYDVVAVQRHLPAVHQVIVLNNKSSHIKRTKVLSQQLKTKISCLLTGIYIFFRSHIFSLPPLYEKLFYPPVFFYFLGGLGGRGGATPENIYFLIIFFPKAHISISPPPHGEG